MKTVSPDLFNLIVPPHYESPNYFTKLFVKRGCQKPKNKEQHTGCDYEANVSVAQITSYEFHNSEC
jgi:hypothetical protein